jgi:hypothetical protein
VGNLCFGFPLWDRRDLISRQHWNSGIDCRSDRGFRTGIDAIDEGA